jgi:D-glycero-D-manno-heptose 1,7-bisphosphate phosphatase
MRLRPAIFFDRDGTVNVQNRYEPRDPEYGTPAAYVCTWDDFEFVSDAQESFELLRPTDYEIIFISNQSGIDRGFAEYADVEHIFLRLKDHIAEWAGKRSRSYFCRHEPELGCACRKPKPGLIYLAAITYDVDLRRSWMIGDSHSDMTAAWNAGIRQLIRICDDRPLTQPQFNIAGGYPAPTLLEAVKLAIRHGR